MKGGFIIIFLIIVNAFCLRFLLKQLPFLPLFVYPFTILNLITTVSLQLNVGFELPLSQAACRSLHPYEPKNENDLA
jgi:hypothetical protein